MVNKLHLGSAILMLATIASPVVSQSQSSLPPQKRQASQTETPATQNTSKSDTQISNSDRQFVNDATAGGIAEVALGQLAIERAANQEVKSFGQRMVDDHSKANNELKQLASSKGITLPSGKTQSATTSTNSQMTEQQAQLTGKHREMMDKLTKRSGADFDREYMRMMLKDHEKDIALFERQANSGNDADLKAFAATTLPTLHEHQQLARNVAAKVGVSDTKSKSK